MGLSKLYTKFSGRQLRQENKKDSYGKVKLLMIFSFFLVTCNAKISLQSTMKVKKFVPISLPITSMQKVVDLFPYKDGQEIETIPNVEIIKKVVSPSTETFLKGDSRKSVPLLDCMNTECPTDSQSTSCMTICQLETKIKDLSMDLIKAEAALVVTKELDKKLINLKIQKHSYVKLALKKLLTLADNAEHKDNEMGFHKNQCTKGVARDVNVYYEASDRMHEAKRMLSAAHVGLTYIEKQKKIKVSTRCC